jgi:hypothetical protein
MFSQNPNMRIEDFIVAGIPEELVRRMIIIESVGFPVTIEAIFPRSYCIGGKVEEDIAREW